MYVDQLWIYFVRYYEDEDLLFNFMAEILMSRELVFLYDYLLYHQFYFQLLSEVRIRMLQFFNNYVVDTHLLNFISKGCGKFINNIVFFNDF